VTEPGSTDSIGERLRNLRQSRGLSQEQLARLLGVSFVTVNRWESGRTNLSAKAAAALAEREAGASLRTHPWHIGMSDASVVVQITELNEPVDGQAGHETSQLAVLSGPGSVWLHS
jgi:transcriptional regulator with XRE-family HTH domain